jgi:hypothetical protein
MKYLSYSIDYGQKKAIRLEKKVPVIGCPFFGNVNLQYTTSCLYAKRVMIKLKGRRNRSNQEYSLRTLRSP